MRSSKSVELEGRNQYDVYEHETLDNGMKIARQVVLLFVHLRKVGGI